MGRLSDPFSSDASTCKFTLSNETDEFQGINALLTQPADIYGLGLPKCWCPIERPGRFGVLLRSSKHAKYYLMSDINKTLAEFYRIPFQYHTLGYWDRQIWLRFCLALISIASIATTALCLVSGRRSSILSWRTCPRCKLKIFNARASQISLFPQYWRLHWCTLYFEVSTEGTKTEEFEPNQLPRVKGCRMLEH
ncbi:hypothetical protein BDR22DRAFT_850763 [Usnea florida]